MGRALVLALVVAASVVGLAGTGDGIGAAAAAKDDYIVVLKDTVGDPGTVAKQQSARNGGVVGFVYRHALNGYSVKLAASQVAALRANPAVAAVTIDEPMFLTDQFLSVGITRIDADASSTQSGDGMGSVNVNVAVIDSGIDSTHPDLNVVGGFDCAGPRGKSFEDDIGHGTQVAGYIAARDNALGSVGVAPGARLFAVKISGKSGRSTSSAVLCGIDWVTRTRSDADTTNDIAVVNMSIGSNPKKQPVDDANCGRQGRDVVHQAVCALTSAGVTPVVAAANESVDVQYTQLGTIDEALTATAMNDIDGQPGGLAPTDDCRVVLPRRHSSPLQQFR